MWRALCTTRCMYQEVVAGVLFTRWGALYVMLWVESMCHGGGSSVKLKEGFVLAYNTSYTATEVIKH